MIAPAMAMAPTSSSVMQRTPENQVQQQCGDGGETTNGGHKKPFYSEISGIIGSYSEKVHTDQVTAENFR
ncbi:hypothetical protein [Rhodopirellula bahusiensis]|uniref:hypothetical protein n=2 Tax=Rhodopirellula bahusiensis TaxID=2014065 RepID=UPI0032630A5C